MFSIDLKDVYLQVPIHPDSCHYLWFVMDGQRYQFKALCICLFTTPQVFTKVMAPVSVILHDRDVQILWYLDDQLVLASSRVEALWARDKVLDLFRQLGIVVNLAKSHLIPSRSATYLGMYLESPSLQAFPSQERVSTLRSQLNEFLSCRQQNVVSWHRLLGRLFSVPSRSRGSSSVGVALSVGLSGRVRRSSLDSRDRLGPLVVVGHQPPPSGSLSGSPAPRPALLVRRLGSGEERSSSRPICLGSLVGRGAPSFDQPPGTSCDTSGSHVFQPVSAGHDSRVFHRQYDCPVFRQETRGDVLSGAQHLLCWAESIGLSLVPQFIVRSQNVVADSLSRCQQVLGS